ncbi:hypothetical protein A2230_08810 [candidate division WOR-1 bacterium RIFOXYA2_FULL_36_21]|uniref:NADH:ubiquinone oxidoreductase intermediate-associated protein 30 domain-containing protein n=1 Tax=candidate division WOR-1 bacterium RIFOXYB2_FULL_36_35 TaxID=1802578 RepID=A0A1F4S3M7_UNCSA|nr:MAG: hypothetical protein A2230_08810 [candidate division WOR-1 bacterium RIFOXYA2_FULL_36_21]OGC14977.1 MAG: hypothetical protein A2290_01450 [candidate division WOR-1 bacterium RIFOXYB2_FULL_36_35]OGC18684.1 MAG: hypothetical protein A2282_07230 [candidate division WOR-1 bacterium RIFOXYA12_FULL_36_13]
MRKLIILFVLIFVLSAVSYGFGENKSSNSSSKASYPYLIDGFADGNYNEGPEWFVFDNIIPTVVSNSMLPQNNIEVGEYSLNIVGTAKNWYVGGMGTVLGIDATKYNSLEMNVYGNGEGSGLLKIELYDDDNGNDEIEVDKAWKPTEDDLWSYELTIDWKGWKHVSMPFTEFANTGRGNGIFDPNLTGGSSGLNKMQLIVVANQEDGAVDFNIDSLEFGLSSSESEGM